jgi:hypothetical protein
MTPENEVRVTITRGLMREANTAFGVYAAIACPMPVYRNSYMTCEPLAVARFDGLAILTTTKKVLPAE